MREQLHRSSWAKGLFKQASGSQRAILAGLALAALLAAAGALGTPAQETTPPAAPAAAPAGSDPTHQEESPVSATRSHIRVRVEVVNVPVTALNKRGVPVIDLTKDDFQVFEDGVQQSIRYFNRETQMPLRIGLILDTSNSARRQLSFEKDAASEFAFTVLHTGSSKNQIFLQTFDAASSIIEDFTNDPDLLNERIRGLKAGGGKALFDAIYFACREKMLKAGQPEDTRRVLVVISDGLDVQSQHSLDEAISMARKAETMVYTIGNAAYGYSNPGDKLLEKMSADTGGAAFFPLRYAPGTDLETGYLSHGQIGDTSQNKGLGAETGTFSAERLVRLADSLEAISRELDEQYNIGYTPARSALDGTYRSIKVVAKRRGVTLRWKPGYFAAVE
jgi:Ca-activated chloride channel family protein